MVAAVHSLAPALVVVFGNSPSMVFDHRIRLELLKLSVRVDAHKLLQQWKLSVAALLFLDSDCCFAAEEVVMGEAVDGRQYFVAECFEEPKEF